MISDPQHDLLIGDLSLVRDIPGREFQFRTESGEATFGSPVPWVAEVRSLLQDGSLGTITGYDNREASFRVRIIAETGAGLAEGEAALFAELGGRNALSWTPPDGWGATTVFDVIHSALEPVFDDTDELRIERTYRVTFTCAPFGRSEEKTITAAQGSGEAPVVVTIDDGSSTTDWSGSVGGTSETVQDAGDSVFVEAPITRTNLVRNPSFESGVSGWTTGTSGSTLTWSNQPGAPQGTRWARVERQTTGTLLLTTSVHPQVTALQTYRLSAWLWGTWFRFTQPTGTIRIGWYDAANQFISFTQTTTLGAPAASTRLSLSGVAPAGAVYGRPWFDFSATEDAIGGGLASIFVDGVMFEQSATLNDYFDGSSPIAAGLGYRWTGTPNLSTSIQLPVGPTELTRSGLTEDFTDTPYLIADFATSAGDAESVAAEVVSTGSGTVALARDSLSPRSGGGHRATFECPYADVEAIRLLTGDASKGAPTLLDIAQLERTSSSASSISSIRQLFRSIEVGGSARTQGSLSIVHNTDALGDVLAYTCRDNGGTYQPPLRAWRVDGAAVTIDTDRVSGATSPLDSGTPETYEVPVSALVAGKHDLMARLSATVGGDKMINWTAATRFGATDLWTISGSTVVTLTTGYTNHPIAALELPPVGAPAGSDAVVRITLSSPDATTVDEAWVFNTDVGALTSVACGTGTPEAGGASTRLWLDTASLDHPRPKIERGTLEDRSDTHNAGADVSSFGTHEFAPGVVNVFTVTSNALNAAVSLEHYKRWQTHAVD